jgi:hypothetical protein
MRKLLVVLLAAACVVGFATSSMAAVDENWALDGRVGFFTDWTNVDPSVGDSSTNIRWTATSVRFRANYVTDKLKGQFEMEDNGVDLAWVELNFGSFFFMFGRNDPITFNPVGTPPGPNCNTAIGKALGGGNNIVRLRFPINDMLTLSVEGANPNTNYAVNAGATDGEITLPQLNVKADFLTGGIPWAVWGGYQTVDAQGGSGVTAFDESISSMQIGAVVRPTFGPVHIDASVYYDVNLYQTGGPPFILAPTVPWQYDATKDTEVLAIGFSANYTVSPKVQLGGGVGYQKWENDCNEEDTTMGYYVNAPITITPNCKVTPYVLIEDFDDATIEIGGQLVTGEQGKTTTYGAYWEVTF